MKKMFRKRLQTKISFFFILFALLIINSVGWLIYYQSQKYFDEELGVNLESIAKAASQIVDTGLFTYIEPGIEDGKFYRSLSEPLKKLQNAFGVKRVYIVDDNYNILMDSNPSGRIGQKIPHLESNLAELQLSKKVEAVYSTLYRAYDGNLYKSAFAPVKNQLGKVRAIACVDASPAYLDVINKIRDFVLLLNLISLFIAIIISLLLARTIVNPVKALAAAAQKVSAGNYDTQVIIKSRDELGFLGNIFNLMQKNIRENEQKLKELSAAVAHEIRNPLNSISLYLGLLKRQPEIEIQNIATVEKTQNEIEILNNIVEEFLCFSRHSAVNKTKFNISELIAEGLFLAKAKIEEQNIEIEVKILPDDFAVTGDRTQLKRALLNLFINAIQAMDNKGVLKIYSYNNERTFIEIIDNGKGIEDKHLDKIFNPFFSTRSNGTGLGLAIVKNIIAQHNGTIIVKSVLGQGTKFIIELPVIEDT